MYFEFFNNGWNHAIELTGSSVRVTSLSLHLSVLVELDPRWWHVRIQGARHVACRVNCGPLTVLWWK